MRILIFLFVIMGVGGGCFTVYRLQNKIAVYEEKIEALTLQLAQKSKPVALPVVVPSAPATPVVAEVKDVKNVSNEKEDALAPTPVSEPVAISEPAANVPEGEFAVEASFLKSVLVVKLVDGEASGFIIKRNVGGADRFFVYTNQHVIAGSKTLPKVFRPDGSEVRLGKLFVSSARDIALFSLDSPETNWLEITSDFPKEASAGKTICVLGNSGGSSTVTSLFGKLLSSGPQLVETDAMFKGGNSGGPMINENGKVVGLVAYLKKETKDDARLGGNQESVIRRFGYRLDNIPSNEWQVVDWSRFVLQGERYATIERFTNDLLTLMDSKLESWNGNEELGKIVGELSSGLKKTVNDKMYYGRLTEACIKLRDLCLKDVTAFGREDLYWWWRSNLENQVQTRRTLREHFETKQLEFNQLR